MPFWEVYHHPSTFTAEQKQELSDRITAYYHQPGVDLPKFYVVVAFLPAQEIFVGGEQDKNFVRFFVHHLAKHPSPDDTERTKRTTAGFDAVLKPLIADRGLNWEYSYFNSPRAFWKINGIAPPPTGSDAETKWREENKVSPYN